MIEEVSPPTWIVTIPVLAIIALIILTIFFNRIFKQKKDVFDRIDNEIIKEKNLLAQKQPVKPETQKSKLISELTQIKTSEHK